MLDLKESSGKMFYNPFAQAQHRVPSRQCQ